MNTTPAPKRELPQWLIDVLDVVTGIIDPFSRSPANYFRARQPIPRTRRWWQVWK
jgi:hypothetical protein